MAAVIQFSSKWFNFLGEILDTIDPKHGDADDDKHVVMTMMMKFLVVMSWVVRVK